MDLGVSLKAILAAIDGALTLQMLRTGKGESYFKAWFFARNRDHLGTGNTPAAAVADAMAGLPLQQSRRGTNAPARTRGR